MFFSIRRELFIIHSFTPPLQYVTLAYFHLYDRLMRIMRISPRSFGLLQGFTFQSPRADRAAESGLARPPFRFPVRLRRLYARIRHFSSGFVK